MGSSVYGKRGRHSVETRWSILANSTNYEFVEGSGNKEAARVIIEWPTVDAGKAFMSDPAYLPHLKARQAGTISNHFLIEGKA